MKQHCTLIRGARIVRTRERLLEDCDILIHHGGESKGNTVAAIEKIIDKKALPDLVLTVVNARGNLLMPSFTDLAVILREPGYMYKEDIASTCKAAMAGGYRSFLAYHEPDSRFAIKDALLYAAAARHSPSVAIYPTAYVKGEHPYTKEELSSLGAVAMTDFGMPFDKESDLYRAMKYSQEAGITFFAFPRILSLSEDGVVNAGIASMMGQKGLSPIAEELAVMRALLLAEETGCRLHLSGVSTKRSLDFIRQAKKAGQAVTCDVSPYHFFFDESAILYHGNSAKLMPPLRSERDRMAVVEAITDGTVDAIASHHTPNDSRETARSIKEAPFGAVALETVFSAAVEGLLLPGYIDIFRLTELLSVNPYRILSGSLAPLSKEAPRIGVGSPADFNLVSVDRRFSVEEGTLRGRAHNTPFVGMTLSGKVEKSFFAKA